MIIKKADDKGEQVALLETLLADAPPSKKAQIKRELYTLKAGIKGEQESAYLLDFHFRDSLNTAVVHDLRLEVDGLVAQIDHLLVHRTYRMYVLETKHFRHGLKITEEGEFLRWDDFDKTFHGMGSPIEQAERHTEVLRRALAGLGYDEPLIRSFVLISPDARVDRPKRFDTSAVVKADQFGKVVDKDLEQAGVLQMIGGLIKTTVSDSATIIADKLVSLHRPIAFDYRAKFGMPAGIPQVLPVLEHVVEQPLMREEKSDLEPSQASLALASQAPGEEIRCRTCGGTELAVQHGKYGYYLKCACGVNTPIRLECVAGHRERIRKQGPKFFRECLECGTSTLYFQNQH